MNKKQLKFLESKGIDIETLKTLRGSKESQHAKDLLEKRLLTKEDVTEIQNLKQKINALLEGTEYSFGVYFHKK